MKNNFGIYFRCRRLDFGQSLQPMGFSQLPVLVINLDRNLERWERLAPVLRQQGFEPTRIAGIDGRKMSEEQRSQYTFNSMRWERHLNDGEIATYLSHHKAWRYISDNAIQHALVLEDDVGIVSGHLSDDIKKALSSIGGGGTSSSCLMP